MVVVTLGGVSAGGDVVTGGVVGSEAGMVDGGASGVVDVGAGSVEGGGEDAEEVGAEVGAEDGDGDGLCVSLGVVVPAGRPMTSKALELGRPLINPMSGLLAPCARQSALACAVRS